MRPHPEDLDYLAARVHGRRSRITEGERLTALCRVRGMEELGRTLLPGAEALDATGLHRRLARACLDEVQELALGLSPARARMLMALGIALDELPGEGQGAAALEDCARRRHLRLARRTFREGSMAFSALVGYAALRLAEVGHLTTLAEGLRLGLSEEVLRARMEASDA